MFWARVCGRTDPLSPAARRCAAPVCSSSASPRSPTARRACTPPSGRPRTPRTCCGPSPCSPPTPWPAATNTNTRRGSKVAPLQRHVKATGRTAEWDLTPVEGCEFTLWVNACCPLECLTFKRDECLCGRLEVSLYVPAGRPQAVDAAWVY